MQTYTTFVGDSRLVSGDLPTVLRQTRAWLDREEQRPMLIFDDSTGKQIEFDLRGTPDEVVAREVPPEERPRTGPGRPKLGVVSREVSMLPRHWEWLQAQPSGSSAALRRLVEDAMRREPDQQRVRRAREAAGRVMTALAGNLPGFEEASRALYAGDREAFAARIREWPADIRDHLERMVAEV